MYKLIKNDPLTGAPSRFVIRLSDNMQIGDDESNPEYQKYLEWLAEGNTPEPADDTENK
jgi:hypothetical protein